MSLLWPWASNLTSLCPSHPKNREAPLGRAIQQKLPKPIVHILLPPRNCPAAVCSPTLKSQCTKFHSDMVCDKNSQILIPQETGKQIMEHPEVGIAWQPSKRMKQKQRDYLSSSFLLQQFPVPSALPGLLPVAPRSFRLTPSAPTPSRAPENRGMFHKELAIHGMTQSWGHTF